MPVHQKRATSKTKKDAREGFKLPNEYTNEKNLPSKIDTQKNTDIKCIVRDLLRPKKLSLIIVTFLGVYVVRDYIMWQDRKKPKKGYILICIVRTILRRPLQDQESTEETLNNSDQETDKNETYENELKNSDSAKIDENSNPNNPASTLDDDNRLPPVMSKYDPNIDYERLMCEDIYEDLKGDPFIEEMMNGIRKNYGEL
ncbi:hypothetical protein RCL_jg10467.t1 [Rhizophagus clarus]|uniref:Uncharacterized protein n=1 Tax=Rhizophagus clarus TaxID=94130 RepID=A0A8H3QFB5_9GLOM|nr:hypothetical protein RCL_jg10467.t1 [Rhizophagus clarus]